MSHVFFGHISKRHQDPTDENILTFLKDTNRQAGVVSNGQGGFQTEYLAFDHLDKFYAWNKYEPIKVTQTRLVHQVVQSIMASYDYFILVERFDESMVGLQLLLGLETSDVLYLSSKTAEGAYAHADGKERKGCFFLHKPEVSAAVAAYLESDEWYAKQYGDYILVEAVKQSLDLTIAYLASGTVAFCWNDLRTALTPPTGTSSGDT